VKLTDVKLAEAIKQLVTTKGIPEELIVDTMKETMMAAYKNFKDMDNIKLAEGNGKSLFNILIVKDVVKRATNKSKQINVKEAQKLFPDAVEGQQIEIPANPFSEFSEKEINWVIENFLGALNRMEKDTIKFEYAKKKNKLVSGNIIKKDNQGNIFVDLGKTIGFLPLEEQSPMEHYETEDRIKAVVKEVYGDKTRVKRRKDEAASKQVQILLSRTSPDLVKELLSAEVPEMSDGSIEIKKIAREPGYKTKLAVYSDIVDPVSSCIGPHGMRITNVVKELGGEKVDVIRYSDEPKTFIKSALTPATVNRIIIQDASSKTVFAVVDKDQLSYAYGKQKKNVVLAAKLCGWKINVKTESEVSDEKIESEDIKGLHDIFMTGTPISELPDLDDALIQLLEQSGIVTVERLLEIDGENSYSIIEGIEENQIQKIKKVLSENVEYEDENKPEKETEEQEEDMIECPHCGHVFKLSELDLNNPKCPKCKETLEIEIEE